MRARGLTWVVAVDGGTSTTRARLVQGDEVVATARRAVGVRDNVRDTGPSVLARAVREVIREVLAAAGGVRPDAIVAAGMLSSDVGLTAVPHVAVPAGLDDLARGAVLCDVPEVGETPLLFVPGVKTTGAPRDDGLGWTGHDVMRGEECETFGALEALGRTGPLALIWPGSHTKLVAVDAQGRIAGSTTTLAGELTAAVARHTLLAASLPETLPDEPEADAVAAGAQCVAESGLGRAAFLVRVASLAGSLTPAQRAAFWIGAVIADDVRTLARHPILAGADPLPVWVGGRSPQRLIYTAMLAGEHRGPVAALDPETADIASALGAVAVARRRLAQRERRSGGHDQP